MAGCYTSPELTQQAVKLPALVSPDYRGYAVGVIPNHLKHFPYQVLVVRGVAVSVQPPSNSGIQAVFKYMEWVCHCVLGMLTQCFRYDLRCNSQSVFLLVHKIT